MRAYWTLSVVEPVDGGKRHLQKNVSSTQALLQLLDSEEYARLFFSITNFSSLTRSISSIPFWPAPSQWQNINYINFSYFSGRIQWSYKNPAAGIKILQASPWSKMQQYLWHQSNTEEWQWSNLQMEVMQVYLNFYKGDQRKHQHLVFIQVIWKQNA